MGFFQKLFGFGDQMFQSDEDKLHNVQRVAAALQKLLAEGTLAQKGDDKLIVRGKVEGRPLTIELGITFGGFEITVQTSCGAPEESMSLAHDSDGARRVPGAAQEPDGFGDVKEFLSDTIYLEGTPDELAAWKGLLGRLPPALVRKLLAHLEAHQARASFSAHEIELSPWKGDVAQRDALDRIRANILLASELAAATEAAWGRN